MEEEEGVTVFLGWKVVDTGPLLFGARTRATALLAITSELPSQFKYNGQSNFNGEALDISCIIIACVYALLLAGKDILLELSCASMNEGCKIFVC